MQDELHSRIAALRATLKPVEDPVLADAIRLAWRAALAVCHKFKATHDADCGSCGYNGHGYARGFGGN